MKFRPSSLMKFRPSSLTQFSQCSMVGRDKVVKVTFDWHGQGMSLLEILATHVVLGRPVDRHIEGPDVLAHGQCITKASMLWYAFEAYDYDHNGRPQKFCRYCGMSFALPGGNPRYVDTDFARPDL